MHLIIDGYNLLHATRSLIHSSSTELQWERNQLVHQLSSYRQLKPCEITVIFDGWQGGWNSERKEWKKGIELIYSKLGEKADEVIKRIVKERGSGAVVITSDREIANYAEKMTAAVIPSDRFREKMEKSFQKIEKDGGKEEGVRMGKTKGPSKRLSKKEKRTRAALKKL